MKLLKIIKSFVWHLIEKYNGSQNNCSEFQCFGFEWRECLSHSFDEFVDAEIEDQGPVRIELDDSILKQFNLLSETELEFSFGKFTPAQSLNPYMTKLRISYTKIS